MKAKSVNRLDFIKRLIKREGFTYAQAAQAYLAFVSVIEDAVVNGYKINVGRVLSIKPVRKPAQVKQMGFKRVAGGKIIAAKRVYYLDSRIKYRVSLYKEFVRIRELKWSAVP